MNKDTLRQIAVISATTMTLIVNGLANALPINGNTTGDISDSFPVYFVPAAYVFSIWGLIYLLLIAFTVYQALPAQKTDPRLRRIGWLYVLSGIANSAWIFLWHYEQFPLTMAAMLALLGLLIAIYLRLGIGRARFNGWARWLLALPFSVYLGWITVATIANATVLLYDLGWRGAPLTGPLWAAILLAVGAVITLIVALTRSDAAYALVIVWAFVGVALRFPDTPVVATTAWVAAGIAAGAAVSALLPRGPRRQNNPGEPATAQG